MAHTAHGPCWSTIWTDLVDPISGKPFPVIIRECSLRHIFKEHVLNGADRDLWGAFVGTDLQSQIKHSMHQRQADPSLLAAFAALLQPGMAAGLTRPLLVTYDQRDAQRTLLHRTMEVLTPSGQDLVIRCDAHGNQLWTAFFAARESLNVSPKKRWLAMIRTRIESLADLWHIDGEDRYVAPSPGYEIKSSEPEGFRDNIRFHALRTWGFKERQTGTETLWIWKAPLPWPPAAGDPQKNPLKPKRR